MEYLLEVNEAAFFSPTQKRDVLKVASIGKRARELAKMPSRTASHWKTPVWSLEEAFMKPVSFIT